MAKYQKVYKIARFKKDDVLEDLNGHWTAYLECGHVAILRANRKPETTYVNCYVCDRRLRDELKKMG